MLIDIRDMERHIMDMAIDKKIVVRENASGEKCIYASMYYYMEASIAKHLIELNIPYSQDEAEIGQRIAQIEEKNDIILDDIQKQAVHKAVLNGLMVITGGPGLLLNILKWKVWKSVWQRRRAVRQSGWQKQADMKRRQFTDCLKSAAVHPIHRTQACILKEMKTIRWKQMSLL